MLPYEEAVEKYKEAVRFDPGFVNAWYGRCFALMVLGSKAKAAEEFKSGLLS
uniref:Tetratricopeptide repeat protein n=1 Tax=Candidatus Desulfatibia profunda TaxID=2841695 RepID=A0A8J6NZG4_9BACT|nr:tetratricopeptide repeat protein [Candidatus Desulfatibia profunda]